MFAVLSLEIGSAGMDQIGNVWVCVCAVCMCAVAEIFRKLCPRYVNPSLEKEPLVDMLKHSGVTRAAIHTIEALGN
jgi:hypothetical protein